MGTIIVGIDGSEPARAALAFASDLGRRLGDEVVAVHALGMLERRPDGSIVPAEEVRDEVTRHFSETWCPEVVGADAPVRVVVEDGPPVLVLLRLAARENASLVVVGSRGLGGAPGLLLGSTSHQLSQVCPVPVLIVPHERPAVG